jgi:hypothetical protein
MGRFESNVLAYSCGIESLFLNSLDLQLNIKGSERVEDKDLTTSDLH